VPAANGPPFEGVFDPGDPEFLANPYPTFARLRSIGELHRHPTLGRDGGELLMALSHRACSAVLRNRAMGRIWSDVAPAALFGAFNLLHRNSLLECEGPRHARLRALVSSAFARGHVERLRPAVVLLAGELVDGLAGHIADGGTGDLVSELAEPLPVRVIAALLGAPASDHALLAGWSRAIVRMYEPDLDPGRDTAAEVASVEFAAYLRALAADRAARPRADLISDLVTAQLSTDELVGTAVLLLMAGHEATVNVLANGVRALLDHPAQWRRLRVDRSLLPTAIEELVRFDSPLQLFERTVLVDTELAGVPVRAGQTVAALLGAAARDPQAFDEPDELDIGRCPNPHLGFGAGVHYCLGAPLARMEVAAALDALLDWLPGLVPAGPAVRRSEFVIRGLESLPVTA